MPPRDRRPGPEGSSAAAARVTNESRGRCGVSANLDLGNRGTRLVDADHSTAVVPNADHRPAIRRPVEPERDATNRIRIDLVRRSHYELDDLPRSLDSCLRGGRRAIAV